jgi:hypothetical protein
MKILAIGNSFSVDAMQWLYNIALNGGENMSLGNLYIGGCSLETHRDNAKTDKAAYTYFKNTGGNWVEYPGKTMLYGIQDEPWDIITMQQKSALSGLQESYEPYLGDLRRYVNESKTNPEAKLAWHMTWAYQRDFINESFRDFYRNDQWVMYNGIIKAVKSRICGNKAFSFIIPSGTAIQNARSGPLGDNLTRDGFHLSYNLGRYIAGMTWFAKITGLPVDTISYFPVPDFSSEELCMAKSAVKSAIRDPFQVSVAASGSA